MHSVGGRRRLCRRAGTPRTTLRLRPPQLRPLPGRVAIASRRSLGFTLWGKEDFITLPSGEQLRIGVALIVPLQPATGHAAVGFFWQPGRTADSRGARRLELLAKVLGLAASGWTRDEAHATRALEQQRISADLQHRLRNNLALMRSVVRRSRETAESAEHFALHLEARVGSLGRTQGMLSTAGGLGVELEELVRTEPLASAAGAQPRCKDRQYGCTPRAWSRWR